MTYISLSTSTVSDLYTATGYLLTGIMPLVTVVIAIPLAFFVARKLIALFPKR